MTEEQANLLGDLMVLLCAVSKRDPMEDDDLIDDLLLTLTGDIKETKACEGMFRTPFIDRLF